MATVPGEIADALYTIYESAPVQAALLATVTSGEAALANVADNLISNLKGSGFSGVLISAAKGTVETQFNAWIASVPPTTVVAFITKQAQQELKALGG